MSWCHVFLDFLDLFCDVENVQRGKSMSCLPKVFQPPPHPLHPLHPFPFFHLLLTLPLLPAVGAASNFAVSGLLLPFPLNGFMIVRCERRMIILRLHINPFLSIPFIPFLCLSSSHLCLSARPRLSLSPGMFNTLFSWFTCGCPLSLFGNFPFLLFFLALNF